MSASIVRCYELRRQYRTAAEAVHALDGVTLEVAAGELVAVMGPSGSGKSTLLSLIGGLDRPTGGQVWIEQTRIDQLGVAPLARIRRDHVGFVFQDFNLISDLTVAENVALPLELAGVRARVARVQALAALNEVDLLDLADRFPADVSGGQQQRAAIARAFVGQRRLILADEPTGALDSATGGVVLEALRRRVDAGAAGILVTHEARTAAWADRTIFLRDGRMVDSTGARATAESLLVDRS